MTCTHDLPFLVYFLFVLCLSHPFDFCLERYAELTPEWHNSPFIGKPQIQLQNYFIIFSIYHISSVPKVPITQAQIKLHGRTKNSTAHFWLAKSDRKNRQQQEVTLNFFLCTCSVRDRGMYLTLFHYYSMSCKTFLSYFLMLIGISCLLTVISLLWILPFMVLK